MLDPAANHLIGEKKCNGWSVRMADSGKMFVCCLESRKAVRQENLQARGEIEETKKQQKETKGSERELKQTGVKWNERREKKLKGI